MDLGNEVEIEVDLFFYFRERVAELATRHFGNNWEEERLRRTVMKSFQMIIL